MANPAESGYSLRYPYDRGTFNEAGYTSQQELLGDIAQIWLDTLEEELEITPGELKVSTVLCADKGRTLTNHVRHARRTTRPFC